MVKTIDLGYPKDYMRELLIEIRRLNAKYPQYRRFAKNVLDKAFRMASDCQGVQYASQAALDYAQVRNIPLKEMHWGNQPKYDSGRQVFILEHCMPVHQMVELAMDDSVSVEDVLAQEATAWITRDENQRLNDKHYQKVRPGGWQKCYAECGIDVIKL